MSLIVGSSVAVTGNAAPTGAAGSVPIQTAFAQGTSATSLTVNFSSNTTTGNTIIVCVTAKGSTANPGVSGITIGGNADSFTYAQFLSNNSEYDAEIWYDAGCLGGQTSVVISFSGGTGGTYSTAAQIYEMPGGLSYDTSTGSAATTGTTWTSTATATTTQSKEIWFGAARTHSTATVTGAWTSVVNALSNGTNHAAAYQIVTSTGTATFSGTQTSGLYTAVVVAFYPASEPSTTLTISPPAGYTAGQTFLLAVIGGGTAGVVAANNTQTGWTPLSATGGLELFSKSATGSESPYTINFPSLCAAAALITSYNPSIVISTTPVSGGTAVGTYTSSPFPSGVTATESVECFVANIANSISGSFPVNFQGGETIDCPATVWQTQVGPLGPGMVDISGTYFPVNIGLVDVVGTASTPTFTSPISSNFYSTFIVLQGLTSGLSGTGTVSATGNLLIPQHGTGTFSGIGTIAAIPSFIFSPLASMSGTGNTAGKATQDTVASSSGTGTVTPKYRLLAAVTSSSTSQIIATPSGSINPGVATLSGLGDHSSQVDTLSSVDTITATGTVAASPITSYTSAITGTGTILATAFIGNSGVSLLAGTGTVSAIPTLAFQYFATLSGQSSVSGYALSAFLAYSYMNAIFQLWTLPPSIIAYGVTSIPATGIVIPRPAIVSHPISTGIGTVAPMPYLIQRGKATLAGTGHLAANVVVPLHDMTKRGRGKVLATPYVTPAPIALIRGAGTLLPKDFFLLSVQRSVTWNTHSKVSQIVVPYWNDLVHVASTKRASWNIVRSPVSRLQGQGNVSGTFPPHATLSGTGKVRQPLAHITRQLGISWNTRVKVPVTQALTWNTIGRIKTSKHMSWNTIVHIDPGVHFTWNTNCLAVSSQQALSWNDLKKVTTSQHCSWNTHGLIKSSKPAIWNTEKRISSIKAVSWNTRAKISPLLHATFNDTGRIKSSQKMTWSLAETALLSGISHIKLAQHLSVGKQARWDTRARVYSSQATSWNDLHRISSFEAFKWNMQGHLIKDLIVKWNTHTGPIQTMLPASWSIYQPDIVFQTGPQLFTLQGVAKLSGTTAVSGTPIFYTVVNGAATLSGTSAWINIFRLFPATNGPAAPISYGGNFISGVGFEVSTGGVWFEGYWWWCSDSGQSTLPVKCALWGIISGQFISGAVVPGSVTTSGTLTAGAWNYIPLPQPVALAIGSPYVAAIGVNGNFPDTSNEFGAGQPYAAGIINGPLSAYSAQNGSFPSPLLPQGVFSTAGSDPSTTLPLQQSGTDNFWVDVQVTGVPVGYSGSYRLWPNKYDSSHTSQADASFDYVLATEIHLNAYCLLNNIWYYSQPNTTELATHAVVYSVLGADSGSAVATITSPSWSGAPGSGWISASFTGGVTLPPGIYKVSVYNDSGAPDPWSTKDLNYWDVGKGQYGINNGPMSAPNVASASLAYEYDSGGGSRTPPYSTSGALVEPGQSTFAQPDVGFPSSIYPYLYVDGLAQNYWIDLELTPVYGAVIASANASLSGSSNMSIALTPTSSNPVISEAPTLSAVGGGAWGGEGPNLLTCSVTPVNIGDLMVCAFLSQDQGSTSLSGGGVTNWSLATSFFYSAGGQFAYIYVGLWWGVVTSTGASVIRITDPSMPLGNYGKVWCREFTSVTQNWSVVTANPAPGSSGGFDLGTGATMNYPVLKPSAGGNDLYVGACYATSYVVASPLSPPGFFFEYPGGEPTAQAAYNTSVGVPIGPIGMQAGTGGYVPVGAIFTSAPTGSVSSGPMYATSAGPLAGGTGTWTNTSNAEGPPDGTYAIWTVV